MALPTNVPNTYVPQDAPGWTDQQPGNFAQGSSGIAPDVNGLVLKSALDNTVNQGPLYGWTPQTDKLNATA